MLERLPPKARLVLALAAVALVFRLGVMTGAGDLDWEDFGASVWDGAVTTAKAAGSVVGL